MRKYIAVIWLALLAVGLGAESFQLNGITVNFDLPKPSIGPNRTEPFEISRYSVNGQDNVRIKFPGVASAKYNLLLNGNLTIQTERVPKGTSIKDYFLHYFGVLTGRKGNVLNADDDIIEGGLPGKFDGLVKNNDGTVLMYDYISATIYRDIGILIVFEITDDLYSFERPVAESIIKSIQLK